MLLTAETTTNRSWAGLVALGVAYVLFRVGAYVWTKIKNPSPTPALPAARRTKVQATVGVTEPEPTPQPVGWWGQIKEIGGVRFRQAQQVVKTGSAELPTEDDEDDEDVDVPLDDDQAADEDDEKVEEYIARCRDLRVPYNQIVRVVVEHYGLSESTAKRRIRDVDEARRPAA
jgi:hypothetical protein